jgi:hypothetical protein
MGWRSRAPQVVAAVEVGLMLALLIVARLLLKSDGLLCSSE